MIKKHLTVIRGIDNLKLQHRGYAVTIGNFDGVHKGHQQLLKQLNQAASIRGTKSLLITFEPHPTEYFASKNIPSRLTNLKQKIRMLSCYGIHNILVLRFNKNLSTMDAELFIKYLLVDQLAIQYLLIGNDFHFGYQRKGNITSLQNAGQMFDFEVEIVPEIAIAEQKISSTSIRSALAIGDLQTAQQLLGRPYSLYGKVIKGDQRGRQLGFPTANIFIKQKSPPLSGVFAVRVKGLGSDAFDGVANIGIRPTIDGDKTKTLLEVHLFDFIEDIYGQYLEVEFLYKLRDEQRFASLDELKKQIILDSSSARAYLNHIEPSQKKSSLDGSEAKIKVF